MSRGFNTTYGTANTDRVVTSCSASTLLQSWALWEFRNGDGGSSLGTLFDKRNSGVAGYRIFRNDAPGGNYEFYATWNAGAQQLVNRVTRPATGAWNHWVITYDGSAAANNAVIYLNGSSVTVTRFGTGPTTGSLDTNSDPYCIGNYNISPFTRAWDGMIADWATWGGVILTPAEANDLAKGKSPAQVRPQSLACFINGRDVVDYKGRPPGLVSGGMVQQQPGVVHVRPRYVRRWASLQSAPPAFIASWASQRSRIIGAGSLH